MSGSRAVLLCVAIGLWAWPVLAQDAPSVQPFGTDILRGLIRKLELKALRTVADARAEPTKSLIVAFGKTDWISQQFGVNGLSEYLQAGGAVWIATDLPTDPAWSGLLGVSVSGVPVRGGVWSPRYRGSVDCPMINRFDGRHPLFKEVQIIATNRPSYLDNVERVPIVAVMPLGVYTEVNNQPRLLPPQAPVMAAGTVGSGRLVVVADHSIFINQMLNLVDADNLDFTLNCLDWLTEGPTGPRTACLFVEDGVTQGNFDIPLSPDELPPLPPIEYLVPLINQVLADFQDTDGPRELLKDSLSSQTITRILVAIFTVFILAYALVRLARGRQIQTGAKTMEEALRLHRPGGGVLRQRVRAQVEQDNLFDTARSRVRQFFEAVSGQIFAAGPMPRVQLNVPMFRRRRLHYELVQLWSIGYGSKPVRVGYSTWKKLRGRIADLERAAERGEWRFTGEDNP